MQRIPNASSVIAGLMSQDDKIKLDSLPFASSSITGTNVSYTSGSFIVLTASYVAGTSAIYVTLSGSTVNAAVFSGTTIRAHISSASYLTGATARIDTLRVRELVVDYSNLTGSAATPDPLSSSIQRSHILSASHFSFITGNITNLELKADLELNNHDLVTVRQVLGNGAGVIDMNGATIDGMTSISGSTARSHILSASYAGIRTATFTALSASHLSASNAQFSTATFVKGNSNTWGSSIFNASSYVFTPSILYDNELEIAAIDGGRIVLKADSGNESLRIMASSVLCSGDVTATGTISAATLSGTTVNGVALSGTTTRAHIASASHFAFITGNIDTLKIRDLVVTNSNITASVSDPLNLTTISGTTVNATTFSGTTVRAHILSASHFGLATGTIEKVVIKNLTVEDSTADFESIFANGNIITDSDIQALTGEIQGGTLSGTTVNADTFSGTTVRAHILSASHFDLVTGNLGQITLVQVNNSPLFSNGLSAGGDILMDDTSITGLLSIAGESAVFNTSVSGTTVNAATFSGTTARNHIASASHFTFVTGNIDTVKIRDLVVTNSNITASVADPLNLTTISGTTVNATTFSGTTARAHILSASHFTLETGSINNALLLKGTTLSGTTVNAATFSGTTVQAHILSASHFTILTGNIGELRVNGPIVTNLELDGTDILGVNALAVSTITGGTFTGTRIETHELSASRFVLTTGTITNALSVNSTFLSGVLVNGTFISGTTARSHILSASHFTLETGSINNALLLKGTTLSGTTVNATTFSGTTVRGHVYSGSHFSFITGNIDTVKIRDLVVINSNITASIPDPFSGTTVRAHILSASHFTLETGSVNNALLLKGATLSGTTVNAATFSGTTVRSHIVSASHFSFVTGNIDTVKIRDLVVTNSNITSSVPDPLTITALTASQILAHNIGDRTGQLRIESADRLYLISSADDIHLEAGAGAVTMANMAVSAIGGSVTSTTISGTTVNATTFSGTIARTHILSASHVDLRTGSFGSLFGTTMSGTTVNAATFSGTTVQGHIYSASHFSFITGNIGTLKVTDLVVVNSNITSSVPDPLSSSIQRTHILSASHFTLETGSINNALLLKGTTLSGTTVNATILSGTTTRQHILSASHFNLVTGSIDNALLLRGATVSGSTVNAANFSGTTIQAHILSASHFNLITGTVNALTATVGYSGTRGLAHEFTSSYFSSTKTYIYDLVVQNSNVTGTASVPDPLSSSIQRTHIFSASHFTLATGSINNALLLKGTTVSGTTVNAAALSGTETKAHIASASYAEFSQIGGPFVKVLNTTFSASASEIQYVDYFSQTIGANETWLFEYGLTFFGQRGTSPVGSFSGTRLSFFSPSGSAVVGWHFGQTTAPTTVLISAQTATNAEHTSLWAAGASFNMHHDLRITVRNGGTAGEVKLGIRRVASDHTCHITTGSMMKAFKGVSY